MMIGMNWQCYCAKRRMAVGREQLAMESSEPGRQLGTRACRAAKGLPRGNRAVMGTRSHSSR